MAFCPKCQQEFRAGFERCADCGVDLVERLPRFAAKEATEEKFAEDLFAGDPTARICPSCYNEFVEGAAVCGTCPNSRLEDVPLEALKKLMTTSVLERFKGFEEINVPLGLVCVHVARSPVDAGFTCQTLESMGVSAIVGNDVLDDFEDDTGVGIYVAADEVEAAQMLLDDDESDNEGSGGGSAYEALLRRAQGYREIQKFRTAQRLLVEAIQMEPGEPGAYLLLGRMLGATRRLDDALRAFDGALDILGENDHTDAKFLYAVYSFLRPDSSIDFHDGRAERGFLALRHFVKIQPRRMAGAQLLFEASMRRGNKETARQARDQMRRLNRTAFKDEGLYTSLSKELGD